MKDWRQVDHLDDAEKPESLEYIQQPIVTNQQQVPPMIQQQPNTAVKKNKHLQIDDALSYLERVRQEFGRTSERYNEFLKVMKNYKNHTIDTKNVILQVTTIFRSHPDLIIGFNAFLPRCFQVKIVGNSIHIDQPNGEKIQIDNEIDQSSKIEGPAGPSMQSFETFQIPPQVAVALSEEMSHEEVKRILLGQTTKMSKEDK